MEESLLVILGQTIGPCSSNSQLTLNIRRFSFRSAGLLSPCRQTQEYSFTILLCPDTHTPPALSHTRHTPSTHPPPPRAARWFSMLSQSILVRQKMMAWSILCRSMACTRYSALSSFTASDSDSMHRGRHTIHTPHLYMACMVVYLTTSSLDQFCHERGLHQSAVTKNHVVHCSAPTTPTTLTLLLMLCQQVSATGST